MTAITTVQKLLHFIELSIQNRLEYMFTPSVSGAYEEYPKNEMWGKKTEKPS